MRVFCHIEEEQMENEYGHEIEGVIAACSRCGHETESYGTDEASINRCLVLMREECPRGEINFYVPAAEWED